MKKTIATTKAPSAIGPYAQAIQANGMIYTSGQIPIDPATGEFVPGGITELTKQSMLNLSAILEEAGSSLDKVVKTTIFLADLADFQEMNQAYASFFPEGAPARSCVQAAKLPKDARVEIEAIALV